MEERPNMRAPKTEAVVVGSEGIARCLFNQPESAAYPQIVNSKDDSLREGREGVEKGEKDYGTNVCKV